MSMKDLERVKSNRVELDDAPRFISPTTIDHEIRKDPADEVECLYADFYFDDARGTNVVITQKYRPFHIKVLMKRMKLLKIKDISKWVNKPWKLEHEPFKGIGFAHYLPVQSEDESQ